MPRIYDADNAPIDFCKDCMPKSEAAAETEFPGQKGYDSEHPPYDDWPGEYQCHECGDELIDIDN